MADIHYLGHACFRLRGRDGIVLCDPYDSTTGLDLGRPTAHIVTVSHNHADHNNTAAVQPAHENVFVVNGPGEYEVRGILITGVRTYHDKNQGTVHGYNTVYTIHIDDVVCCHLGDLGHELTQRQLEEIGNVDILFVPVGGGETINATEAAGVIGQIEPRIVIPMHYALPQHTDTYQLASLEPFTHELGLKDVAYQEKLSITASSLPNDEEETRIVLMRPLVNSS